MSIQPNGKTVLITGTSTGIGRATALHLDRQGFEVIGTVRRAEDAQNLQAAASANLRTCFLDVTDPDSLHQFGESLKTELGQNGLWGLVNNAGAAFTAPLEFTPLEQLRHLFEVDLFGLLAVTQIGLPYLRQAQGRIINISSTASLIVAPFHGPYSAAKWGLNGLSNALRLETRPFGIQVSVIICGSVRTPIWERGGAWSERVGATLPPESETLYGEAYRQLSAYFRKLGERGIAPEDIAQTIAKALTSERAKQTYYAGRDARLFRLFHKFVGERRRDRQIMRLIGLPY